MFTRKKGFTLVEVLIGVGILAFCLCGILVSYINMFILSDLARDITLATTAVQDQMENIKKMSFDSLSVLNSTTFAIAGFSAGNARGRIEVTDSSYTDLKRVRIIACFKSRQRVIGEDTNLNGALDGGEDANGNGRLDSSVEVVTLISR